MGKARGTLFASRWRGTQNNEGDIAMRMRASASGGSARSDVSEPATPGYRVLLLCGLLIVLVFLPLLLTR